MFYFEKLVDSIGRAILLTSPFKPVNFGDYLTLFGEFGFSFPLKISSVFLFGTGFGELGNSISFLVNYGLKKTVGLD